MLYRGGQKDGDQGYRAEPLVLHHEQAYKAVPDFTHETVCQSDSASQTIQSAIDAPAGEGGEVRLGSGSIVRDNGGHKDKPHQSGESAGTVVQSFEAELTARFIAEQL